MASNTTVITYTYDALNRLTAADYSSGDYFYYEYDSVGKREVMTTSLSGVVTYTYDLANRITAVGISNGKITAGLKPTSGG